MTEFLVEKFDPGKFPSFVHPAKKSWIELGDEELNQIVPTLSGAEKTYLEMITSEEYQSMLAKLEKYVGFSVTSRSLPQIVSLFYESLKRAVSIESTNKQDLEKLALQVVLQLPEFEMVREAYENKDVFFDVKLELEEAKVSLKPPDIKVEEELSEAEEMNAELAKEFESLLKEGVLRRRLANLFIQGMATLKMHLFNLVVGELSKIDKNLPNLYGILAVGAELGYWVAPPMKELKAGEGGKVDVQPKGKEYLIKARAVTFPFLINEIVKGVYEWLSIDPDLKDAMKKVDSIEAETGDVILGPGFAKTFQRMVPADKQKYLPLIYRKFLQLPSEEIKAVLAKGSEGRGILSNLIKEAEAEWEEYLQSKKRYDFEISQEEEEPEEETYEEEPEEDS